MAANGRPVEISFTPSVAGTVKVTATFSGSGGGSDWGSVVGAQCFVEQSGTTSYGTTEGLTTSRIPHVTQAVFSVSAGSLVKCGMYGYVSGASSCTFYDVNVIAEFNPT